MRISAKTEVTQRLKKMAQILVKDDQSNGQYIAIVGMESPAIISSGTDPKEVYNEAQQKHLKGIQQAIRYERNP